MVASARWSLPHASAASDRGTSAPQPLASAGEGSFLHAVASICGSSASQPLACAVGGSSPHLSLHAACINMPGLSIPATARRRIAGRGSAWRIGLGSKALKPGASSRPGLAERPEPEQSLDDSLERNACCFLRRRILLALQESLAAAASPGPLRAEVCTARSCRRGSPSAVSAASAACTLQSPGAGGTPCIVAGSAGAATT